MTLNRTTHLVFVVSSAVLALATAAYYLSPKPAACLDLQPAPPSPLTFQVQDENLDAVRTALWQNETAKTEWQDTIALVPPEGNVSTWVMVFTVDPRRAVPTLVDRVNPVPIASDTEVTLYTLVRNAWKKPHALRLVFLLDYQQVQVAAPTGVVSGYYDFPVLQPQADGGVAVRLPKLTPGFHQLSILSIADPDNFTPDSEYRLYQQHSFFEDRYDLWVDADTRPADVPAFENVAMGQAADSRTGGAELVLAAGKPTNEPLLTLTLKPGEATCVNLRIFNSATPVNAPYTAPVPLHIVTFWNDQITHFFDYQLLPTDPEHLTFQFKIQAPAQAGRYQLSMVIFKFPGYSQFGPTGRERTGYAGADFSRRVVVDVVP